MKTTATLLWALLWLGVSMDALGAEVRITNVDEFIQFKNNVNIGTSYSGTTVFLDTDLSLTEKSLEPIGNSSYRFFLGVFDGQGHVISNLLMAPSSSFVGLFGCSVGLTIKNVVLHSSCSVTSSYSDSAYAYVGGIIGSCNANNGPCTIENSVNMANVTFDDSISISNYLYLGGIAGYLKSSYNYDITVKNCANYGDVTHSGTSSNSYIGGIAGDSYGFSSKRVYIYNSLNYGTVTHNGTASSYLCIGGITGQSSYTTIENCVSGGEISYVTARWHNYIGSIVGYVSGDTTINYCYFTSELSYGKYGYISKDPTESNVFSYDSTSFELDETASVWSYTGNSLICALNEYADKYTLRYYSRWLLNKERKDVAFTINKRPPFTINSQVILLPSLANEGNTSFDGWYEDNELTTPFMSNEVTETTNIFGKFEENTNNYTITFDTRREGVSVEPITAQFGSVVTLPNDLKNGECSLVWWENKYGDKMELKFTIQSHNVTLYSVWKCTRIETPEDVVDFSKIVNSGTSYSGTTVFLDSDLSLAGKSFEPIGTFSIYFRGAFDGQGHVISNLALNSSSQFVGLFGYVNGLITKNVVLHSSCSVTSSYNQPYYAYVGGILGCCEAYNGPCTIENSVNMGSVTFSGNMSGYNSLYLGGIAGHLRSYIYESTVKNCANYGDVTHSGTSRYSSFIGGIVGHSQGSSYRVYIYNCPNYGTITHSGTTANALYLGGVVGHTFYTVIENCVSAGNISSSKSSYSFIGSIVGLVSGDTSIKYCYFTNELSRYTKCSESFSYDNTTFKLNENIFVGSYTGSSLIGALNAAADYYTLRGYSHWLLNKGNKDVSFTINGEQTLTLNSQVILLPSLASEGKLCFDGWYDDSSYSKPFTTSEITNDTNLYGKTKDNTNNYTITFDTRKEGVSVAPITAPFGTVVTLPSDLKNGECSLVWWENKYGDNVGLSFTMSSHNITLYAVWKCVHIKTTEDFVDFSKIVNSRMNYYGTTVFLDSDLSFTGKSFEPIGTFDLNYFLGVFDGQGHVISNLAMNSSSYYPGLFGYSRGLTIKNAILDSSCSITSSYIGSNTVFIGGIIGWCNGLCRIENSVSMGSVTFSGDISNSLSLGGIAGQFSTSSNYDSVVKNCANYGDVTHSGTSSGSSIGGFIGSSYGYYSSSKGVCIYNSINYGTTTHKGTTLGRLYLGGIAGSIQYTTIENCVSGGKIPSGRAYYTGSIVGYALSDTVINYCYFTSDLGSYDKYGYTYSNPTESNTLSYDNITFELNETVFIGSYTGISLIDALNAYSNYYTLGGYSHWLLNKDKKEMSFSINKRKKPIRMNYQLILLPSLASEGNMSFDGWYEDSKLTKPLTTSEVSQDTNLYGRFEEGINYTISFDTRREGVSVAPITAPFGSVLALPSDLKNGECSLIWWENKYGDNVGLSLTMPAHNITLYAVWKCTRIKTYEDFVVFSKVVNNGMDSFNGSTVFLDSDLSFARKTFEPIGNSSNYFNGTFDGQGHVISNLALNSSSQFVGLFGYSRGLTIKNVVLDSSCSITSSFNSNSYNAFVGGIIGYCSAYNRPCTIENSVNMGSVIFRGTIRSILNYLYLGGIAGYLESSYSYDITVKNCANYGDVTHAGRSEDSYIGGIAGYSDGYSSSKKVYIYNSLNLGTIKYNGTTSDDLYLGGIAGNTEDTSIENCVSGGEISYTTKSWYNYIGSIVGDVNYDTTINYTYFTSDLSDYKKYGTGTPLSESNTFSYNSFTFDLSWIVSIGSYTGSSLIDSINAAADYYTLRDYSHWILNKERSVVSFTINGETSFTPNSQIILLPSLAREGNMSFVWYTDVGLTTTLTDYEITNDTKLYGSYCGSFDFTVTLDAKGGELAVEEVTIGCNRVYGDLPSPNRTGYSFVGWFTEKDGEGGELVTPNMTIKTTQNHTLYAHWSGNNYTVTFNQNGGNISQPATKSVTFDSAYGKLPTPSRTGYAFLGWFTDKNESITEESIVNIPDNHTLHAHWIKISRQVEIIFIKKDMTRKEIEEFIKKYTDADFEISKIESHISGGTRSIIVFNKIEDAKEFFEIINNSSEAKGTITKVGFIQGGAEGFSTHFQPMMLFYLF